MSSLPARTYATGARRALATLAGVTAAWRVLPDFLILGAQRGGTASLYYTLTRHPSVAAAVRKEVHYFDLHPSRGARWYRGHFPTRPAMAWRRRRHGVAVTGEATPYYLFHPAVPARVAAALPEAKFIVLLRNPTDRAYSHYVRELRKGRETLSFADALAREAQRLMGEETRLLADPSYVSPVHQRHSYRARGVYVEQLRRWMSVCPRERFLIVESEAFYADPAAVFDQVVGFLDLPSWRPAAFPRYNELAYAPPDPSVRAALDEFYAPHTAALEALLGRRFSWRS